MTKETDLKAVKTMAIAFLYMQIEKTDFSPMVVQHPVFETAFQVSNEENGLNVINLLEDAEQLETVQQAYRERIENADSVEIIFYIIRKSYWLTFLKYIKKYLSKTDFSKLLAAAWVDSENPNEDVNVSIKTLISWYKFVDKSVLMDSEDYKIYLSLPEKITVYRGVKPGGNEKGLSWTRNIKQAKWFADRFEKNGYVLSATIDKENVLAYFDTRGEEEIIVDTSKLEGVSRYDGKDVSSKAP